MKRRTLENFQKLLDEGCKEEGIDSFTLTPDFLLPDDELFTDPDDAAVKDSLVAAYLMSVDVDQSIKTLEEE